MSVSQPKPWTREDFFAWEGQAEGRYEFDGVQPVEMNGVTVNHATISRNLDRLLDDALKGTACRAFGPQVGIAATAQAVRYPDAFVSAAAVAGTARMIADPVVVFEILSPTSGRTDRIVKLREYAGVASIRRYLILEPASVGATVLERQGAGQIWRTTSLMSPDKVLRLPELGIAFPLGAAYESVALGDGGEADR
jgi:Uma2 family endonuclease